MKLIRDRRKKLHLSYDRAAALAGISGTRWRQLEDGFRTTKVGRIPEDAPARTLARMAAEVSVTPAELAAHGCGEAAEELSGLIAERTQEDGQTLAEAERMVAAVQGLSKRQRERLRQEVARELRLIRAQDGLTIEHRGIRYLLCVNGLPW